MAHPPSSRTPGYLRDCKLETPLRKRRSRISITNEFSAKRQRISEAIGSIHISTETEQRQEYADINAEPRVSELFLFGFPNLIEDSSCALGLYSLDCYTNTLRLLQPCFAPPLSYFHKYLLPAYLPLNKIMIGIATRLGLTFPFLRQTASLPHVRRFSFL
jgi:hypothetical protein